MMTLHPTPSRILRMRRAAARAFWRSLYPLRLIALWRRRLKERRWLISMDDHMLRDLGISRSDAWAEWEKPFWRA